MRTEIKVPQGLVMAERSLSEEEVAEFRAGWRAALSHPRGTIWLEFASFVPPIPKCGVKAKRGPTPRWLRNS